MEPLILKIVLVVLGMALWWCTVMIGYWTGRAVEISKRIKEIEKEIKEMGGTCEGL